MVIVTMFTDRNAISFDSYGKSKEVVCSTIRSLELRRSFPGKIKKVAPMMDLLLQDLVCLMEWQ